MTGRFVVLQFPLHGAVDDVLQPVVVGRFDTQEAAEQYRQRRFGADDEFSLVAED
ncbi:hypothetical protein ACRQ5Q_24375 [Bradyrhizobium sp. PMVTL-01]|uniref:hypothetical protein n=1 Tax=Bradyrhizobium sp. PMVTL-01 TaxID=3434999 RepID=UPI003F721CF3